MLADDQHLVGSAFAMLVTSASDMEVVAEAGTGQEAVEAARTVPADLIVMDIRMPETRLIAQVLKAPPTPPAGPGTDELSGREREVLTLVGRGTNNTEIGEALDLSPLTAKKHVSRVMAKLHARDRPQLVIAAYESGLVTARTDPPRKSRT
ncbi:response regulator transcription factor [Streptomyces sp. NPDC058401]|uniref:response regulator transcription factor n=1 Tax=Streptomyces sp. NPDC058401 TaxID=3346480 RepID=UPI003656E874